MTERKTLKDYMTPTQKAKLGNRATLHKHCMEHTGVARPGKTAREGEKKPPTGCLSQEPATASPAGAVAPSTTDRPWR